MEATIGHIMLKTTALALDDREVGDLAHQHFSDYAESVTLLHNVVPGGGDSIPSAGGPTGPRGRPAGDQPDDREGLACPIGSGTAG